MPGEQRDARRGGEVAVRLVDRDDAGRAVQARFQDGWFDPVPGGRVRVHHDAEHRGSSAELRRQRATWPDRKRDVVRGEERGKHREERVARLGSHDRIAG